MNIDFPLFIYVSKNFLRNSISEYNGFNDTQRDFCLWRNLCINFNEFVSFSSQKNAHSGLNTHSSEAILKRNSIENIFNFTCFTKTVELRKGANKNSLFSQLQANTKWVNISRKIGRFC